MRRQARSRTSSSTDENDARRRDRPAQRHDDDGGRRRHRRAARGDDVEHAADAVQLPAARRARGPPPRPARGRADDVPRAAATTTTTSRDPIASPATRRRRPTSTCAGQRSSARILASELLRRAFAALAEDDDDSTLGVNVHGQFGTVGDWPTPQTGRRALAHESSRARSKPGRSMPCWHVDTELADRRDDLVRRSEPRAAARGRRGGGDTARSGDLSEELAERGCCRCSASRRGSRYLYHAARRALPLAAARGDRPGALDRRQPVRSRLAARQGQGGPHGDRGGGLGPARRHGGGPGSARGGQAARLLPRCLYIDRDHQGDGDGLVRLPDLRRDGGVRRVDLRQPRGFRTDFRPKDFEGSFDCVAGSGSRGIVPKPGMARAPRHAAPMRCGDAGRIYVVNDNNSDGWRFAPASRTAAGARHALGRRRRGGARGTWSKCPSWTRQARCASRWAPTT